MTENDKDIPLLLWPFYVVWRLLTLILNITGRIICAVLGMTLLVSGFTITLGVVTAPIGIALAVFGFLLLIRALF
jgi:hypothetical protein